MPKPQLAEPFHTLEGELIDTLLAGLHQWRSDLAYPESHSDMQACVRGLFQMFQVQRLAVPNLLKLKCYECEGIGKLINLESDGRRLNTCKKCNGHGWLPGK